MDRFRYVLGLLLVIGLPPGLAWWFIVHPFVGFWRRLGATVTMTLMTLFFIVSVSALFLFRDALIGRDLGASRPLVAVGIVFIGAGFQILIKRRKYLTTGILAGVPEVHAEEDKRGKLLDQGPYAAIRHPRYVEILFFTLGYAAVSNHVGPYVLAGLTFPIMHVLVLLEERELLDRFGEAYREYCERVPRYIPW
jgi:protein-S-isoprenylcysteine O-methyltransferase Ste14